MRRMLFACAVSLAAAIGSAPAGAQAPAPSAPAATTPAPAASAAPRHHRRSLAQMFQDANTTGDGHLTRDQAAKMPAVARDFDAIDKTKKGYVTLDDIRTYRREMRAERRVARRTAGSTVPSAH